MIKNEQTVFPLDVGDDAFSQRHRAIVSRPALAPPEPGAGTPRLGSAPEILRPRRLFRMQSIQEQEQQHLRSSVRRPELGHRIQRGQRGQGPPPRRSRHRAATRADLRRCSGDPSPSRFRLVPACLRQERRRRRARSARPDAARARLARTASVCLRHPGGAQRENRGQIKVSTEAGELHQWASAKIPKWQTRSRSRACSPYTETMTSSSALFSPRVSPRGLPTHCSTSQYLS